VDRREEVIEELRALIAKQAAQLAEQARQTRFKCCENQGVASGRGETSIPVKVTATFLSKFNKLTFQ
jgi:hypothetical protein